VLAGAVPVCETTVSRVLRLQRNEPAESSWCVQ
jgi:hypothetical protein